MAIQRCKTAAEGERGGTPQRGAWERAVMGLCILGGLTVAMRGWSGVRGQLANPGAGTQAGTANVGCPYALRIDIEGGSG